MAKLTFGKFNGWDTEKLAQTSEGRDYLEWGAENLRSPKWRKEFQRVLDNFSASDIDIMAEAKAILANSPDIGWDEAETVARVLKEEAEQAEAVEAAMEQAKENLRNVLSATAGVRKEAIDVLVGVVLRGDFWPWVNRGKIQFSSSNSEKNMIAAVKAFEVEIDGLEI